MAKIELKFLGCRQDSSYEKPEHIKVEVYQDDTEEYEFGTPEKEIAISGYSHWSDSEFMVNLDISTAIKFAKTLRTEINKAKEVSNG